VGGLNYLLLLPNYLSLFLHYTNKERFCNNKCWGRKTGEKKRKTRRHYVLSTEKRNAHFLATALKRAAEGFVADEKQPLAFNKHFVVAMNAARRRSFYQSHTQSTPAVNNGAQKNKGPGKYSL